MHGIRQNLNKKLTEYHVIMYAGQLNDTTALWYSIDNQVLEKKAYIRKRIYNANYK